eukprot:1483944-Lingulodinium_polyedra.AAC.1
MLQMGEQHRAERLGFEDMAVHAFGGMEQVADERALVARARVEEVNELLSHFQDVTMSDVEVNEEAGHLRYQVIGFQAVLRESGVRDHANLMA